MMRINIQSPTQWFVLPVTGRSLILQDCLVTNRDKFIDFPLDLVGKSLIFIEKSLISIALISIGFGDIYRLDIGQNIKDFPRFRPGPPSLGRYFLDLFSIFCNDSSCVGKL